MTLVNRAVLIALLAEISVAAAFAFQRVRRETPPLPNLERLDTLTADEVREIRSRVRDGDPASWQELGDVYLSFGFFAEADVCYEEAATCAPPTHELLLRWGICLDRLGQLPAAIARYEQAAETAGDERRRSVCLYHQARCHLREQRADDALEVLLAAGDFELAQYELAKLSFRLGRLDAAATTLDRMLQRYPDELKLNQLRQKVAEATGDWTLAQHCRDMIERSTDRLFVDSTVEFIGQMRLERGLPRRRAAAAALESNGNLDAAADSFLELQQIDWDPVTAKRLVRLNFRRGQPAAAEEVIAQLRERYGDSPETLEQSGDAAYLQGRVGDAVSDWERALALQPGARLHQLLAEHYEQAGVADKATRHRAGMEFHLGIDSFRENDLPTAIDHLLRAVEIEPQSAESWFWLAEAQRQTGDVTAAKASYAKCLALQANHGRALDAVGQLAD